MGNIRACLPWKLLWRTSAAILLPQKLPHAQLSFHIIGKEKYYIFMGTHKQAILAVLGTFEVLTEFSFHVSFGLPHSSLHQEDSHRVRRCHLRVLWSHPQRVNQLASGQKRGEPVFPPGKQMEKLCILSPSCLSARKHTASASALQLKLDKLSLNNTFPTTQCKPLGQLKWPVYLL